MADVYTEGYRVGFINTGKDLSKKSIVNIRYSLGFEKVICLAIENFRKMGLKPVIYRRGNTANFGDLRLLQTISMNTTTVTIMHCT